MLLKILLIRNDNIGDLVCTTPAIEAIRKKYPDSKIDIVVNSLNSFVVKNNPFLDRIYIYTKTKHKNKFLDKVIAFLKKGKILYEIKKEKYDICIIFRSSYSKYAGLFAKISKAKRVIGVDENKEANFITDKIPYTNINEAKICFEILKPLEIYYGGEKTFLNFSIKNEKYKDFIFFHVSSRVKKNKISKDKICEILKFLKTKYNNIIITAEDDNFASDISKKVSVEYLKTNSLNELISYLQFAKFLITLDGGIAHIAPVIGVNTLIIFGKTDMNRWKPIYTNAKCIALQDETKLAENVDNKLIFDTILKEFL